MENKTIEKIIRRIQENPNGISINLDSTLAQFSNGFIVATTNNQIENLDPLAIKKVQEQIIQNPMTHLIGSWFSYDTHKFYIDASLIVPDLRQALALALKFNQEAIYDVSKNQSIYLAHLRNPSSLGRKTIILMVRLSSLFSFFIIINIKLNKFQEVK